MAVQNMAVQENRSTISAEDANAIEQMFLASEADLYVASRSLKAMGHPLRLKILCILANGNETSVQDLVDLVGTSQSNISQHLSILRDKDILASRKEANKVFYRIGDDKILALMETMREAFCSTHD
ncbi:MAG: metalloregulator ArsR/SmtB family transcription factor [Arenicellales bacterium]|jgi:ArsR family transcriptional regulator|nr:metalloregulator ArsR/SmtB family transcription factor [Arenicellales bacterium]